MRNDLIPSAETFYDQLMLIDIVQDDKEEKSNEVAETRGWRI